MEQEVNKVAKQKRPRKKSRRRKENWTVFYSNVQGIKSKRNSLVDIFEDLKPRIALITETQLSVGASCKIDGYTFFSQPRERAGGGVGIFIDNEIRASVAPHMSKHNLEIIWVSVSRGKMKPIYMGVYYGKQETEGKKEDREMEIGLLSEEIMDMQQEGEIMLFMDANAKTGLMGEPVSGNGKLLIQMVEETALHIVNMSAKCRGVITRQNRKRPEEVSAIDYVMVSDQALDWICEMTIDEEGLYRPMSKNNETDHNSIIVKMVMEDREEERQERRAVWNIKAPTEKWEKFRTKLDEANVEFEAAMIGEDDINRRYNRWENILERCAMESIGKTTLKREQKEKFSEELEALRDARRNKKKSLKLIDDHEIRKVAVEECIKLQSQIKDRINEEKKIKIQGRIEGVQNPNAFWMERRRIRKDNVSEWLRTKDDNGNRIYDEEGNKENMASYYENLYKRQEVVPHAHHRVVYENMEIFQKDKNYEDEVYNSAPSIEEITEAVEEKKGGKSTTDFKNEMIKKGGKPLIQALVPLIEAVWNEEEVPSKWNHGLITSLWKGKNDREMLRNHRGITVSSAIGTIPEVILNKRYVKHMKMTQAQAGGRANCSTYDHVFIARAMIAYGLKTRKPIFITFFDVQKAFDHADVDDMFDAVWKSGVRGKIWRLGKKFQERLTAEVKTRFGNSRSILRECGGKQGGHLMATIFGLLMDSLADSLLKTTDFGVWIREVYIPALLFVDDVMSISEGKDNQKKMLDKIADFAVQHKMEWGVDKCKVMQVGRGKNIAETWQLGDKIIESTSEYKYLGDIITRNGTNRRNLEEREKKVNQAVRGIKSCAQHEIMEKVQNQAILRLHETVVVPTLLYNAESWTLTKSDEKLCEKVEIGALKSVLGLPKTFPSTALIYATGTLYASLRIDKKQLLYLHKILCRDDEHWTKHMLKVLDELDTGWTKHIKLKLNEYGLECEFEAIKNMTKGQWRKEVVKATEAKQKERLESECKKENGEAKEKTRHVLEQIQAPSYQRKPSPVLRLNRGKARIILMARYKMLDCAANYSHSYESKHCATCQEMDDENHRLNGCGKVAGSNGWIDFKEVYSEDMSILTKMANEIAHKWSIYQK